MRRAYNFIAEILGAIIGIIVALPYLILLIIGLSLAALCFWVMYFCATN